MGETAAANNHYHGHQVFDVAVPQQPAFKCFDDDGRLKRTGYNLSKTKMSTFFHKHNTNKKVFSFIIIQGLFGPLALT